MSETKKKGLGRGLSALFGEDDAQGAMAGAQNQSSAASVAKLVPIAHLEPCPFQPRRHFDSQALGELAESLKRHGVLQPLLVRPLADRPGTFQIVAGERRWRAAQRARLHELPVVIRDLSDREVLEIGLIENLQRQDLQPLEEADTYKKLIEEHGYKQEELSEIIGKSRSHIANMMRLLALPDGIKAMMMTGNLSAGHARTLVGVQDGEKLAQKILQQGLSVRAAERLVASHARKPGKTDKKARLTADINALEQRISQILGVRVAIKPKSATQGVITIPYESLDQFDELLRRFGR